ncbi:hypothetical protein [Moraxella sp. Pampa]|uniref:hypothetical protein n=1 Tax=Moraxella sp. Pampa TaxID=3111978 RepID=UPI002B403399|nr:hypothetical protein [Moraxella sp. Pampa]
MKKSLDDKCQAPPLVTVKVTPGLQAIYLGKSYDVSTLPVTVGQKLLLVPFENNAMVSLNGEGWRSVPEVELDETGCRIDKPTTPTDEVRMSHNICYNQLTDDEKWLLHGYRSLDECDQSIIDYLMCVFGNQKVEV